MFVTVTVHWVDLVYGSEAEAQPKATVVEVRTMSFVVLELAPCVVSPE